MLLISHMAIFILNIYPFSLSRHKLIFASKFLLFIFFNEFLSSLMIPHYFISMRSR